MKRRVKLQAPRHLGAFPALPVQPAAGYSTSAGSPAMERQTAAQARALGAVRPLRLALVDQGADVYRGILLVSVEAPSIVRFTDLLGLDTTPSLAQPDDFTAFISCRPVGGYGDSTALQDAPIWGGYPSRRSYVYIPFMGEWQLRVSVFGPTSPNNLLAIDGQIFEGMTPEIFRAFSGGASEADSGEFYLDGVTTFFHRISNAVNGTKVVLAQLASSIIGGCPTFVQIGANPTLARFNMLNAGLNVNNLDRRYDLVLQSVVVQNVSPGNDCSYAYTLEKE